MGLCPAVQPAGRVTVAVLSEHPTLAAQLAAAGHEVLQAEGRSQLVRLTRRADVVVLDVVGRDDRRGLLSALGRGLRCDVPVLLIGADDVDIALLGPDLRVEVVVPTVRVPHLDRVIRQLLTGPA